MASVVVNGDTSGAVTLTAPAVAGTVTVTLPSTSGVMAVGGGTITTLTTTSDITVNGLTVGRGGAGGVANTAYGASAIPIAPNSGVTAIGSNAGKLFNTASDTGQSTFVGYFAGAQVSTGTDSTFVGGSAGTNTTTGAKNTAVGSQALQFNTTASSNTAVGYQAGYSNTTGGANTFFGYHAGYSSNATNGSNVFIGYRAGKDITTGVSNVVLGGYMGNQGGLDIRTASNYIVLSDGDGNPRFYSDSGGNLFAGASNISFSINSTGGYSRFGSISATNVLQVAYNSTSSGVSLTSAATSWGTFSDQRLKNVTGVYENALSDIAQIEPIKFTWKSDESNKPCVGVLAHTVKAVVPEAVEEVANSMEDETLYLQVRYTELIPLMIASIKELKAEVDSLKAQINGASA